MASRLGNVIYWLGAGLAALLAAFAAYLWATEPAVKVSPLPVVIVLILAAISWLVGRAVKYVLAD